MITLADYKGTAIEKGFITESIAPKKKLSIEEMEVVLKSNLEKGLIDNDLFEKAMGELDLLKGEGARGGKVIGHTKSGKPVYEKHDQETSKDYTSKDHSDAADIHKKESEKHNEELQGKDKFSKKWGDDKIAKIDHHTKTAGLHNDVMNEKIDKEEKEDKEKGKKEDK